MKEYPLVSVIVRTKDRPQLLELAIKSIAEQVYRPLEVVLVNDGGCDLEDEKIKAILGDIPLNYQRLEENTGRAHAANVGIENAKGKFIGFLDDDDLFYRNHFEILVSVLEKYPYKIAYSDANIAYISFDPEQNAMITREKRLFSSKDFSYRELIIDNYIPLMCILFSREIFEYVSGFDEHFDVYEDWDLLIRIAEKHPFHHVKKVTAEYIQWSTTLQIAQSPEFIDKSHAAHIQIITKHRDKISPEIVRDLVLKKRALQEKENTIATLKGIKAGLEQVVQEKEDLVTALEEVRANLDTVLREKEEMTSTLEGIKNDLGKVGQEKEAAVSALDKVSASYEKAHQEKEEAVAALAEVNASFEKALREKDDITATLDRMRKNFDETLQEKERIVEILDGVRLNFEKARQGRETSADAFEGVKKSFEKALEEKEYTISTLRGVRTGLEQTLQDKESAIFTLAEVGEGFERSLREKEEKIAALKDFSRNLEKALQEKENIITIFDTAKTSFDTILNEKLNTIFELEESIKMKDAVLDQITGSHGWRMLSRYYTLRDRLLPPLSKRRLFYELFFLAAENPRGLMKSLSRHNMKRFFEQYRILDTADVKSKVKRKIAAGSFGDASVTTSRGTETDITLHGVPILHPHAEENQILVIDRFVPTHDKDSGSLRMYTFLQILVALGYKVTFLPDDLMKREPYVADLRKEGIDVLVEKVDVERYLETMGGIFAYVILSRPEQAYKYLPLIRAYAVNSTVIYDTVDLHWIRFERAASVNGDRALLQKAQEYRAMELFNSSCSDIVFTVTENEKEFLLDENPDLHVEVMPNIHEVIKEIPPFEMRKDLMFIGGFLHQPNEDGVFFFVREIFPMIREQIPDVRFFVVGSDPSKELQKLDSHDVKVTGYVKDVMPFFNNCRVFVSPLRYGAGMKGKIGQSMGYGLPVVTTTIGAEGIGMVEGETALIADGPEDFANAVVKLYTDADLWNRMSAASIRHIEENYSREVLSKRISVLFDTCSLQKVP